MGRKRPIYPRNKEPCNTKKNAPPKYRAEEVIEFFKNRNKEQVKNEL